MQIRDQRSCIMDIILPCLMIIMGIYVSKLEIVPKGHPARNLSLYDFPRGAPLIHNLDNTYQEWDEIEEYLDYGFSADIGINRLFSEEIVLELDKS